MKPFKSLLSAALLAVTLVSCDVFSGEPDLPIPLDETLANTAGFVRVLAVNNAAFDLGGDLSTQAYSFNFEVSDEKSGELSESITFYVTYVDRNRVAKSEVAITASTISVSGLTKNTKGLPAGVANVKLTDILSAYGANLSANDLKLGDRFDIRWVLSMKDGTSYTNTNVSQAVTGGFYRSPFFARANVVVSLPESKFVGTYTVTQNAASSTVAGAFLSGWLFGSETFDVELTVDPDNKLVGRIFSASPYAEFGHGAVGQYKLAFGLATSITNTVSTGLQCSALGLYFAPAATGGSFNAQDDSSFTFVVTENSTGDCGLPSEVITFTAVKGMNS
jgi:hypothetical protein